ncbi:MAG: hypothetical protein AABW88_05610 [Nanoarchaeota archaeon]
MKLKRILCIFLGRHRFMLKEPLNIKSEHPLLSVEGYVDYKCSRCGKESHGYFYSDGFRTLSWCRLLSVEEKKLLIKDPYCFLKTKRGMI